MGGESTLPRIAQAYLLAGGGSTRFGRDKALVEIDGIPMLLRIRVLLGAVSEQVTVIAPPLRYAALGVTAVSDRWEGQGPLAGIITALRSALGLEPLCACWRTSAAAKLKNVFDGGVRKITEAMKSLEMEVVDEADWKRFDSAGRLFWNMNTVADFDEAKRILEAQRA